MERPLRAWVWAAFVGLWLTACGSDGTDRVDCTDATECREGDVCVDGYCASTSEARVSASATASGASAPVYVIDAAGKVCEASSCKQLPYNTQVTFRAGEAPGFRFTGWTGSQGCAGTEPDLIIPNLTSSVQCVANYVRRVNVRGSVSGTDSTVTATAEGPAARCETSTCQVDAGQSVRLSVQQRSGERFLGWSGAGCGDAKTLEITVQPTDGDITCVATFVGRIVVAARAMNVEALIDVAASSPAVVCEPQSCQLDKGGSATLSAPEVPGFRFAGWSGTMRCTGTSTPLTLNDLGESQLCVATYLRRVSARGSTVGATPPPAVTALSSDVGADCLGPACQVDVGGSVTLLASSAAGYRLTGWSGPMCEPTPRAALALSNIQGDLACVASYVQGIAVIGAVVGAPGTVTASSTTPLAQCAEGGCIIDQGGNATLTAPTIEGYRFMAWEGDPGCESREPTVRFEQVAQSRTCYARYAARFIVRGTLAPSDAGTVRATSATAGSLCNEASCTLDRGGEVTLEATPGPRHRFSGWSGGGACTGSAPALRLVDIAGNTTCQANFQSRLTVTGVATPEGVGGSVVARSDSGAATCLGAVCSIDAGSRVTLSATPALGYRFSGWSDCATSVDPNLTLEGIRADTLCRANFVPLRFTVSGSASPVEGGSVLAASTAPGAACQGASCAIDFGGRVVLTATPNAGFTFASWTGCGGGTSPSVTVDDVRGDVACQAVFTRVVLTASASAVPPDGGTVSLASSTPGASCTGTSCSVPYGGGVIASAAPASGHRFVGWSGCSAVTTPTVSLDGITTGVSCQARFERLRVTITAGATPQEGGAIDVRATVQGAECAPGRCSVDFGAAVTVTATPAAGFQFRGWTGCRNTGEPTITLANLMESATCTASFARFRYPVSGEAIGSGTVVATSPSPGAACVGARCDVDHGSTVVLTPTAAPGFRFASWAECPVTGMGPVTIANVTGMVLCRARFEAIVHVVQGVAVPPDGGTVVGQGSCVGATCMVPQGGSAALIAMPAAPAYGFTGWSGAGCVADPLNPLRVTVPNVTGPVVCTATFGLQAYPVGGLTVGGGSIAAAPGMGATCAGAACTVSHGGSVIFTATSPGPGAELAGWSGLGCMQDATEPLRALVTNVMAPTTCTATFRARTVTVSGTAVGGTIVGAPGQPCTGASCAVPYGSDVTFVATPLGPSYAATPTWAPATCVPEANATRATVRNVTATTTCTATFAMLPPPPTPVAVTATSTSLLGTTTVTAPGCVAATCLVLPGTIVTLTATPAGAATFASWAGVGCPAAGTAMVIVPAGGLSCSATFNAPPPPPDAGAPTGAASLIRPLDLPLFSAPSADASIASR